MLLNLCYISEVINTGFCFTNIHVIVADLYFYSYIYALGETTLLKLFSIPSEKVSAKSGRSAEVLLLLGAYW